MENQTIGRWQTTLVLQNLFTEAPFVSIKKARDEMPIWQIVLWRKPTLRKIRTTNHLFYKIGEFEKFKICAFIKSQNGY